MDPTLSLKERLKQYQGIKENTREAEVPEASWVPKVEEEVPVEEEEEIEYEDEIIEEDVEDQAVTSGPPPRGPSFKVWFYILIVLVLLVGGAIGLSYLLDFDIWEKDATPRGPTDITATPTPRPSAGPPGTPTSTPISAPSQKPTTSMAPSQTPTVTPVPTTLRLGHFIRVYLAPIVGEEVLEDRSSAQYRAADYIADEDYYVPDLVTVGELADRYFSVTLYFATGGDQWTQCSPGDTSCASPWLTGNHCDWFGITCDEAGRMTSMEFTSDNGLAGVIPPEVYLAEKLETFVITDNKLEGTIPETMSQLTNLSVLDLHGNDLTGSISLELCGVEELVVDCEEVSCACCTECF